ncbi:MAG: LytTR family transcriptional regulator [Spirochaetia bacterium]|nr:LytTR family transcriptional regulator [Spirochaetia bacterium]
MLNLSKKNKYIFLIWLSANVIHSSLIALLSSQIYDLNFFKILPLTIFLGFFISIFASWLGFYSGRKVYYYFQNKSTSKRNYFLQYFLGFVMAMAGSLIGLFVGLLFLNIIISYDRIKDFLGFMICVTLISVFIISIILATIDILLLKNREYKKKIEKMDGLAKKKYLTIKEKGGILKIKYKEIQYISSSGKKSILHTDNEDITISVLLKDIIKKLPEEKFLRVHKAHVVNLEKILSMRSVRYGAYQIYLNNEDDTPVPIGKKYLKYVREVLG